MRLVRRHREDDLDRADELPLGERGEDEAAAALDLGGDGLEGRARLLVRERRHVADRGAALDAVDENGREAVELPPGLDRAEPPDLDSVDGGHRGGVSQFTRRGPTLV